MHFRALVLFQLICMIGSFSLSIGGHKDLKLILTNDDGWAEANIRAANDALKLAGYNVVLSAPSENKSGTGSSTAPPTVLNTTCEFDTCPVGSPPEGFNASDPRLNYVNAFPVDSVRFGIQTLAPKFFRSKPDFVVSGFNVGANLGSGIQGSGTVGAACEAAKEGIPSVAFSAVTGSQISFTTLDNSTSPSTFAARTYASLTTTFVNTILKSPVRPILPPNITVNVNFPASNATTCADPSDFSFVFTRILPNATAEDVFTCGSNHLPDETTVVDAEGCFASVSVFDAVNKADVDKGAQAAVFRRVESILSCFTA